jgi:hypothetical protein
MATTVSVIQQFILFRERTTTTSYMPDLSELENTFAAAFDTLERPDLAALVRNGKKYQRLPFIIGSDFMDLPNLFLAFRQLVLNEESKPTFEDWKKIAWEKYKSDHSFLALKR